MGDFTQLCVSPYRQAPSFTGVQDQQCSAGVPTVVARRMLQQGGLVGRTVNCGADAASVAAEGADLVFIEVLSFLLTQQVLSYSEQLPYNHRKLHDYVSLRKIRSQSLPSGA